MHNLPVRLVANGGGLVYAPLGPTHQSIEDIALLRSLPNLTIVAPCDEIEMEKIMYKTLHWESPIYIRIAKGDEKIISIAAASIVAKVARDLFMIKLGRKYPKYKWNKNFGYGTNYHIQSLKKYGATNHHRKKFKPVHNILIGKTRETL